MRWAGAFVDQVRKFCHTVVGGMMRQRLVLHVVMLMLLSVSRNGVRVGVGCGVKILHADGRSLGEHAALKLRVSLKTSRESMKSMSSMQLGVKRCKTSRKSIMRATLEVEADSDSLSRMLFCMFFAHSLCPLFRAARIGRLRAAASARTVLDQHRAPPLPPHPQPQTEVESESEQKLPTGKAFIRIQ